MRCFRQGLKFGLSFILKAYIFQGADISEEKSELGLEDDLHKIIEVCDVCFSVATESEVEGILNGVVSMLALVTGDKRDELILSFCEKLSKAPSHQLGLVCLKVNIAPSHQLGPVCLKVNIAPSHQLGLVCLKVNVAPSHQLGLVCLKVNTASSN